MSENDAVKRFAEEATGAAKRYKEAEAGAMKQFAEAAKARIAEADEAFKRQAMSKVEPAEVTHQRIAKLRLAGSAHRQPRHSQ